ncbi:MAG TPA: hypothetical protein VFP36_11340 [Usitatibacter sp.]|nr:hypothetical protein [Usitatibacter sp.]
MRLYFAIIAAALASCAPVPAHEAASTHAHDPAAMHMHDPAAPASDARELVNFPAPMREHTLANMRDHLQTLQEINAALSRNEFEKASALAEQRLGMTSLELHGAAHLAAFMPKPMQEMGTGMHRAASRFAIAAQDASVSHDLRPALAALSDVMRQCAACHAAYRLH